MSRVSGACLAGLLGLGGLDAAAQSVGETPEAWSPHVEPASEEAAAVLGELELAEGFRVELFAAEPQLANPVCLYVDHQGGVWVAETFRHFDGVTDMRDHPTWLDEDLANRTVGERLAMIAKHEGEGFAAYGRATDRVRWMADTDGDGRADIDTVFAEGFTAPEAGIGAGLLVHGGDVYFTCIPSLYRLRDEDGNRRADVREELSTGYGVNIALLGHDLHGLRIGPDGKLYFSSGDRGFHVETEDRVIAHPHTGAVLRCDLDGSNLEVFATGLRNPQELVFDEFGNLWTGDNNSDGGDKARWVHVVEGSDSGWRYSYQWLTEPSLRGPWNDERLWHPHHEGQAAYILPPVANLASGPSGLTYDRGTGLPAEFARHFFLCDFRGDPAYSGIHAFTVEPQGAGWELGPVERLLWNGLPTDVDFGPDGSLYVSDWVNGWNKTGKGRVFRVFDPDALSHGTAELLAEGVAGRPTHQLAALISHPDQRVRQLAQLELAELGAVDALRGAALLEGQSIPGQLHALWGLGMLQSDAVYMHAQAADPQVRAQVCRILGDWAGEPEPLAADAGAAILTEALADPDPRVRMHAAIALSKWPQPIAGAELVELLRADGADPVVRHAAVTGLVGQLSPEGLAALASDASVEVRVGAVVALRRLGDGRVREFLGDADPLVVLEAARAIHDVPIEAGLADLAGLIERGDLGRDLGRRVINANHRLHTEVAARALLGFALRPAGTDELAGLQVEALDRLREWTQPVGRDAVTGAWLPIDPDRLRDVSYLRGWIEAGFSPEAVSRAPAAVQMAWCELLAAHAIEGRGAWFRTAVANPELDAELRVLALELLADSDEPDLVATLERALFDGDAAVRAAALTLAGSGPATERTDFFELIEAAATRGELPERRAAYGLLADGAYTEAEAVLTRELKALAAGELPPEVALELVRAANTHGGAPLADLLAEREASRGDAALAPFLDGLYGGDAERGRKLFTTRSDLQCLRCHTTGLEEPDEQVRAAIGPTLAGLGTRATRRAMLTSIVDPNREIAGGFRGTLFFMRDGGRIEGQVLEETGETVRVLDAEGEEHGLAVSDIETRRAGLSAMPEGLGALVDPFEMRDLLEFLSGL